MTLAPLMTTPWIIQLHVAAALAALLLGIVQLVARKGTLPHRTLGWVWVALMATVAVTSFWIQRKGTFGPIHALSIMVLVMLPVALFAARNRRVRAHRLTMLGIFIGGLIIAGGFTLMPGRLMNAVAFGVP